MNLGNAETRGGRRRKKNKFANGSARRNEEVQEEARYPRKLDADRDIRCNINNHRGLALKFVRNVASRRPVRTWSPFTNGVSDVVGQTTRRVKRFNQARDKTDATNIRFENELLV